MHGSKAWKILTVLFFLAGAAGIFMETYYVTRSPGAYDNRNQAVTLSTGPGLGQCHWIGGPYMSYSSLKWGYSQSTPFIFENDGGDSWAAIEQQKGQYNFTQLHGEVDAAKGKGKSVWLNISVANLANKEHNVPKWLLDQGVETPIGVCGNLDDWVNKSYVSPWDDGTVNSVKPVWDNPKYVDQSEAALYDVNGNITTNTDTAETVYFQAKFPAVWDPLFRENFADVLNAMKNEFQTEIDDGVVQAIVMHSGGTFGESGLGATCAAWGTDCTPDVLNSQCPFIQSMAKIVRDQHYPELTVDQVAQQYISKKSNCDPSNVVPGNKVQLCEGQTDCPTDYWSYCFVFDDYFIQAMKLLISTYVGTFSPTPVVWQDGSGLSGTGRTSNVLQTWMADTYGNRVWFKFNGWGPQDSFFWTRDFNRYAGIGAHGYEVGGYGAFSKEYYAENAQKWCDMYLSTECDGDESCLPAVCKTVPLNTDEVGRTAVSMAIKKGIVEDKSSYLCMQTTFYDISPTDEDSDGLKENLYFFNPDDNSEDCSSSEINVSTYGYGFCPGYLNHILQANVPGSTFGSCTPVCAGRVCGFDGCGGSCGSCPASQKCNTSGVCATSGSASGDLNGDGNITVSDYALFIVDYRAYINDGTVNSRSDLNNDNKITVSDYAVFMRAYLDSIS